MPGRHWIVTVACGVSAAVWSVALAAQSTAPVGLSSRRTTVVTYEARRTTKVDLLGTPLLPRTRGEAEIETEAAGPVRITARVRGLTPPTQFGSEYLSFVLWAVPPQGRAKNLGELRLDDGDAAIETSSDIQTFALIVTAEPYYAVTTPSEVVVMENVVRLDTRGLTSIGMLEYEIVPRGAYVSAAGGSYGLPPPHRREPPDVQQARNAVAIARIAMAEKYAASAFANAQRLLGQAEQIVASGGSRRDSISQARAAVQAAEGARLQATEARVAAQQEEARQQAAAREREARQQAERDAAERRAVEAERALAEEQRLRAEDERVRAEQLAEDAAADRQRAEDARRDAERQTVRAEAERERAERDRANLRATLMEQFSRILETRDTARGLIVNVGDVLFETGRYQLRPIARESLARFAGIVLAHPDLYVQAEGFTDSTGTSALNELLSSQRAAAVANFLVDQGVAQHRVATRGYGAAYPVASNETAEGRQRNRRVELVVTGEVIGSPIGTTYR